MKFVLVPTPRRLQNDVVFGVFLKGFGPKIAVLYPKSGYSSTEVPYVDFELLFLVASAT